MTIQNVAQLKATPWTTEELESMGASVQAPAASSAARASSSSGSGSGSGSGTSSSSDMGQNARITTDVNMGLDEIQAWEPPSIASLENQQAEFGKADTLFGAAEEMLSGLREKNAAWLKGEVPDDVAEQLREKSAQSARMGGIAGSQAARNLQARDLGLTSMQIQESGMQREAQLSELSKGLGAIREQRAQFMTNLHEQSKQFGANLADQMTRTQLAHRELILKQEAFNAEQNMRLVELITQSTLGMMQLQVQAAGSDVDFSGGVTTFEALQSQLENLLSRSNPKE